MRTCSALLLVVALWCAGCSPGSDSDLASSPASSEALTFGSLGLDWPRAKTSLVVKDPPAAPRGFDDSVVEDMAPILTKWAGAAALDKSVWHSTEPFDTIGDALPGQVAKTLRKQVKDEVSPRLAVANVFADGLEVVGRPVVTTAWKVSTAKDDKGKRYGLLQLQTRTAYEVRRGGGPTRVIGVLRVHGLSAYENTTDDFGVSGGWQEFGAGDCALALDDDLVPDAQAADAAKDLKAFIRIGNGSALEMPPLGVQEQVDAEYLKRCREGAV